MLFVTSMSHVSIITKQNFVAASVGMVFLVMRKDVVKPRHTTSESGEHSFGNARTIGDREMSVKGMDETVGRMNRQNAAVTAANLLTYRDPKKGYQNTYDDFIVAAADLVPSLMGGSIDVLNTEITGGVACMIWEEGSLRRQLESVNKHMKSFLCEVLFVDDKQLSPFCVETYGTIVKDAIGKPCIEYLRPSKKNPTKENEPAAVDDTATAAVLSPAQEQAMFECTEAVVKYHDRDDEATALDEDDEDIDVTAADEILQGDDLTDFFGDSNSNLLLNELSTLFDLKRGNSGNEWCKIALSAAMNILPLLTMKKREAESTKMDRKVKSLRERWFSIGGKTNDSKAESCCPMLIERDVVVSLPLKQPGGDNKRKKTGEQQVLETADYIIMGVYTKAYNKWFLSDQKDSPIW
jgi:hypothetical protein